MKQHNNPRTKLNQIKQFGFTLIELMVGLAIMTTAFMAFEFKARQESQLRNGEILATSMQPFFMAQHDYVRKHRIALQNDTAITGFADPYRPTAQELKTAKFLSDSNPLTFLRPGGAPVFVINRIPAGCTPSACDLEYKVTTSQPYLNSIDGSVATGVLSNAARKVGGAGGYSDFNAPGTITGESGWTSSNPNGAVAGIFGIYQTYSASGEAMFLTMFETRDPQFTNNVTVNGNIIAPTGTIGTGTGNPGGSECRLGEILASGAFWSRSATCIKRAWVDGANGEVGVADAAGNTRGQLKGTGELELRDAIGNIKSGFRTVGTESNAVADNFLNNAGNAGLRANGEVFGREIVIDTTATVGNACTTNNATVWGTGTDSLTLLKCVANVWVATGLTKGAVGGACPTNGQIGETPGKVSIICVNNTWMTTTNRMGSWSVSYTVYAVNGSVLGKPACGSGGQPLLIEIPQGIDADKFYTSFSQTDNGSTWTVNLTDGAGNPTTSKALSQGGCWYI